MGILKTSEAPVEDIPLPVALMEMPAPEVLPAAEGAGSNMSPLPSLSLLKLLKVR